MRDERELCARQLKREFNQAKTVQRGRPYQPAERWRNMDLWLSIADNCLQVRADPVTFVQAAFTYNQVPGGPFPNQLQGPAARKWYEQMANATGWQGKAGQFSSPFVLDVYQNLCAKVLYLAQLPPGRLLAELKLPSLGWTAWERVLASRFHPAVVAVYGSGMRRDLTANARLKDALVELNWDRDKIEDLLNV